MYIPTHGKNPRGLCVTQGTGTPKLVTYDAPRVSVLTLTLLTVSL
jgi:hypothetical protein